jgi:hypothetical protein
VCRELSKQHWVDDTVCRRDKINLLVKLKMSPFSSITVLTVLVVIGIRSSLGTHYPSIYYVYGNCDQTIEVRGDVRIQLASTAYLPSGIYCALAFQISTGHDLTAKFLSYNMSSNYTSETGNCPYESIQLYDVYQQPQLSRDGDYCSSQKPNATYYIGASGKLRFATGFPSNIQTAVVDILISEITLKKDFTNSTCPSSLFDCGNGHCISKDITCNGFDDCGNNVDEENGCGPSLPPGSVIV